MKRRMILPLLLWAATLNSYGFVNAEIQTYTDQCLSFQYDDETPGAVTKRISAYSGTYYNFSSLDSAVNICIDTLPDNGMDGVIYDDDTDYTKQTVISDDEMEIYYKETGYTAREKVIAVNDTQYVYISYSEDDMSDTGWSFIDSIQLDDSFKDGYVFEDPETEYPLPIIIYRNKCYSEQGIVYANQALNICNKYLTFEIDGKEASSEIEELQKRLDSYLEKAPNGYDYDVKETILLLDSHLSGNDDAEVIGTRDVLQLIVDAGVIE